MASIIYVLHHSTDDPDRAATALLTAASSARGGHDVALWLSGEGVRLGVEGVAETLAEPLPETAAESWQAIVEAGGRAYLDRPSFERRQYETDAVREGAEVADPTYLALLLSEGRTAVTM
ncbi:MAG: DsrE family protein [Planctomycetota bacterium]|nr:DsrE family protein [Planctomycetota bacterium]